MPKQLYEVVSGFIPKAVRDRKDETDTIWRQNDLVPFQTEDRDGPCYMTRRDLDRKLRDKILVEYGKPATAPEPSDLTLAKFKQIVSDFGEVAALNDLRRAAKTGLAAKTVASLRTHISRGDDLYDFKAEMLAALAAALVVGEQEAGDGDDGVESGGRAEGPRA